MTEIEHQLHAMKTDVERSTEDIRNDISKKEENIHQTVEQIVERIKEKLDWREYVKAAPYWALGAAAGLGCLASRSPKRAIKGPLAEKAQNSFGGPFSGAAGPGLIKVAMLGIATRAAANWLKNSASTVVGRDSAKRYSSENPGKTILITLGIGAGLGYFLVASSRASRIRKV